MENTNDFRKYSYSTDTSLLIESFNQTRSSAAPKLQPQRKRNFGMTPNLKVKTHRELVSEEHTANSAAAAIVCICLAFFVMLSGIMFTFAKKNELNRQIANVKSEITVAQSTNVSLNSELEALISVSQIDSYAVDKLGMVRLEANRIRYIDTAAFRENFEKNSAPAELEE